MSSVNKVILVGNLGADPEEFGAFFDGVQPRLADIKKASENTYNHVIAKLGERDAELRLAA